MFFLNDKRFMFSSEEVMQEELKEIYNRPIKTQADLNKRRRDVASVYFRFSFVRLMPVWISIALVCFATCMVGGHIVLFGAVVVEGMRIADWTSKKVQLDPKVNQIERNDLLSFVILPSCQTFFQQNLNLEVFEYVGEAYFNVPGYYFSLPKPLMDPTQALVLKRKIEREYADFKRIKVERVIKSGLIYINGNVIFIRKQEMV